MTETIKIAKAQEKVRKHVAKLSEWDNKEFVATPRIVKYWWSVLNNAIFEGQLYSPKKIHCKARMKDLGWCMPLQGHGHVELAVRRRLKNKRIFFAVLVHEMVHQCEWHNGYVPKHGKKFFLWKQRIYEITGLELSRKIAC